MAKAASRSTTTIPIHSDDEMQYLSSSSHNTRSVASIDMTGNIIGGTVGVSGGSVLRSRIQKQTGLDSHDEDDEEIITTTSLGCYDDIVTPSSSSPTTTNNKEVTRRGFAARRRRLRAKNN